MRVSSACCELVSAFLSASSARTAPCPGPDLLDEVLERRLGQRAGLGEHEDALLEGHQRRDRGDVRRRRRAPARPRCRPWRRRCPRCRRSARRRRRPGRTADTGRTRTAQKSTRTMSLSRTVFSKDCAVRSVVAMSLPTIGLCDGIPPSAQLPGDGDARPRGRGRRPRRASRRRPSSAAMPSSRRRPDRDGAGLGHAEDRAELRAGEGGILLAPCRGRRRRRRRAPAAAPRLRSDTSSRTWSTRSALPTADAAASRISPTDSRPRTVTASRCWAVKPTGTAGVVPTLVDARVEGPDVGVGDALLAHDRADRRMPADAPASAAATSAASCPTRRSSRTTSGDTAARPVPVTVTRALAHGVPLARRPRGAGPGPRRNLPRLRCHDEPSPRPAARPPRAASSAWPSRPSSRSCSSSTGLSSPSRARSAGPTRSSTCSSSPCRRMPWGGPSGRCAPPSSSSRSTPR